MVAENSYSLPRSLQTRYLITHLSPLVLRNLLQELLQDYSSHSHSRQQLPTRNPKLETHLGPKRLHSLKSLIGLPPDSVRYRMKVANVVVRSRWRSQKSTVLVAHAAVLTLEDAETAAVAAAVAVAFDAAVVFHRTDKTFGPAEHNLEKVKPYSVQVYDACSEYQEMLAVGECSSVA